MADLDNAILIDQPLDIGSLTIVFHEMFFDYYLRAPGQPDGYYVTDIGEQKVGFGSKYQLRKFMENLKEERFSTGVIPERTVKVQPIPELSTPVVRRLGAVIPVVETKLTDADHQKRVRGENPNYDDISEGTDAQHSVVNVKPTGPQW